MGFAHEIRIYMMGGLPAFSYSPDDQRLSPSLISCNENTWNITHVIGNWGFDVGSYILLYPQLLCYSGFRACKAEGQKCKITRPFLFCTRNFMKFHSFVVAAAAGAEA